jgi:hypothetical protein
MKRLTTCSHHDTPMRCGCSVSLETEQHFPKENSAFRINRPFPELADCVAASNNKAYSYIVTTVTFNSTTSHFEQHGSGPNFQGGVLTLCTCKRQMRARLDATDWRGKWVAGFTSRTIHEGKHWLFYLMQVEVAYDSHSDLWNALPETVRDAKAAHKHFLGDVFVPKTTNLTGDSRFDPSRYHCPSRHAHIKPKDPIYWHNDINYQHAARTGRQPPLLVAEPSLTYIWKEPMLYLDCNHHRDYEKWANLQDLIARLKEGY